MAFRKRRFRSRGSRSFRAPLARKRRTWVTALRSGCAFQNIPWNASTESCETVFKLVLFDNALLEGGFSDRCTIRRIIGDIWFYPTLDYARATTPEQLYILLSTEGNQFMHVGLLNADVTRDAAGNLTTGNVFPWSSDFDYSEAQWLKTWQHNWAVTDNQTGYTLTNRASDLTREFPVYKPDVHTWLVPGTAACNELVSGSGLICIETTGEVECEPCEQPGGFESESLQVSVPKKWGLHLDIKKRISMRENNELYLNCDWAIPDTVVPDDGWTMGVYTALKILVEMG